MTNNLEQISNQASTSASSMPLIINKSLLRSSFVDYLGSGFKIKESCRTPLDSVILPRCSVAILLAFLPKTETTLKDSEESASRNEANEKVSGLFERIRHFSKHNQNPIIVIVSPMFGEEMIHFITSELLLSLLPKPPLFLLAHGEAQAATHVQLIAKATHTDAKEIVKSRVSQIINQIVNSDVDLNLLRATGLSTDDSSILLDIYGSFEEIIKANPEEIHSYAPLDKETATAIFDFLNKDVVG